MMKKIIFAAIAMLVLNACESAGSGVPVDIPDVAIDCDTGDCQGAGASKDAYVYYTLSGCNPDQVEFALAATATLNVSCSGAGCTGIATTWRNSTGQVITQIPSNRYYVCAWIDINGDAEPDAADEFGDTTQSVVDDSGITISDWDVIYTFSRSKARKNR